MTPDPKQEIVRGLSDTIRSDVQELTQICNAYEGIDLPIFLETDSSTSVEESPYFSYYRDDVLLGFAYIWGQDEPEVYGMVHPDHRRNGIGRMLLDAVRVECRRRGALSLLIVCEDASPSGRAFVAAVGARLRFAEYGMQLDPAAVSPPNDDSTIKLHRATLEEAETVVRLQAAVVGDTEEAVRPWVLKGLQEPHRRYYLGMLNDQPIGSIRLTSHKQSADITAFGVLPVYRRRGYGRQMLQASVAILLAEHYDPIMLEVVTENVNALELYRSCGFRERSTYGYYELALC